MWLVDEGNGTWYDDVRSDKKSESPPVYVRDLLYQSVDFPSRGFGSGRGFLRFPWWQCGGCMQNVICGQGE